MQENSNIPFNTYPRIHLVRDSFINLNGEWDFTYGQGDKLPEKYDRKIFVPYAPETALSGINEVHLEQYHLFYHRTFNLDKEFIQDKVILHFGAVDQIATVYINGHQFEPHVGGYNHFEYDITSYINEGENDLNVMVFDFLSWHYLPYGKQKLNNGGMWYTPISGIWQTVWLESVPNEYIQDIVVKTHRDEVSIIIQPKLSGTVNLNNKQYTLTDGICQIKVENPIYWSPENPHLYNFSIQSKEDFVNSYFGLRDLEIKDIAGFRRLCLNGKPYFFNGLLDQGYWQDGNLTPKDYSCFEKDILTMKKCGYNTLRKHIKIEPDYFYYACDKLGMIVFQDFVNNGKYSFIRDTILPTLGLKKLDDKKMHSNSVIRNHFINGMKETVKQLYSFPCICYWTIFNEGWGQFDSDNMYFKLKELDNTRFIDSTSGWFFNKETDVHSEHCYFKPFRMVAIKKPIVLSEFGGYAYKDLDHCYNPNSTYGYRKYKDISTFRKDMIKLYETDVIPNIPKGLCGAIYTQVCDVEDEVNGLLTYDRQVLKVDPSELKEVMKKCTY